MSEENLVETPAPETETVTADEAVMETEPSNPTGEENKTDEPADNEPAKEQKPEPTEAEKIKYAMQKRIDRQTAKNAQMERELAELKSWRQQMDTKQETGEPKEDQYETVEEYLIAKGAYQERKKVSDEAAAAKKEAEDKAYAAKVAKIREDLTAKETEFRKVTPDYDDAVTVVNEYISTAEPNSVHLAMFRDFVMESDNPTPLLYKLGKNPSLIEEMSEMSPIKFMRQLIKLEMEIENAPKVTRQTQTQPPTPIKGSASGVKPITEMSYQEMKKAYKL